MFYFNTQKTANPITREVRDARVPILFILGAMLQVFACLEICLAFRRLLMGRLQMASFCLSVTHSFVFNMCD